MAAEPLGFSDPFSGSQGWVARYGDTPVSQFNSAQMIADKWNISREQMGAYLCIASNDVPPAVSKRIILNVNCEDGSAVDEVACAFSFVCFFDTKEKREGGGGGVCNAPMCAH